MIIKWGKHYGLECSYLMFDINSDPNRTFEYVVKYATAIHHIDGKVFNTYFNYLI